MSEKHGMMDALENRELFSTSALVDGRWVEAASGETIDVLNPADGTKLGTIPSLSREEVRRAIDAAARAWRSWRKTGAQDRSNILKKWYALILENQRDLALMMTLEQGKPLAESSGEVVYAASFVEWFAEEAKRTYGDVIPAHRADARVMVVKEPVGVCAAITPWNFPAAMVTRKVAAALAAGCVMVLKPAEETPFSALALARLGEQAGIPEGVFNVITGAAPMIGSELAASPIVRKCSFTGSTRVGRLLMDQCAPTVKKMSLELGGNAPFIVFEDADLDAAVQGAIISKFRNSGQTCVCANRFVVQKSIYEAFTRKFCDAIDQQLKLGDGRDQGVNQGPLVHARAVEKMEGLVADAVAKGANVVKGGARATTAGQWWKPTVLTDVTRDMRVFQEEIFGPIAPLVPFETEQEAIDIANDTDAGLAAYFYTRDLGRSWRVSEALEYGMVGVNTGIISTAVAPFGGRKQSGFGVEGSRYGIDEYLVTKYLCVSGI